MRSRSGTHVEACAATASPSERLPPRSASPDIAELPRVNEVPELSDYQIISRIGVGGMGTVWKALQLSTGREVALKFLNFAGAQTTRAQLRFVREIELASRLEHPYIARVYDSGIRDGVYCYAMELIDGVRLDSFVRQEKLSPRQMLSLMVSVCRAVQHAHQRGVIHRDLKPSNILVDKDGNPHVLDFGLGKSLRESPDQETISLQGEWAGTPAFMSPEQAEGKAESLDTRTDVYSLGVILYFLLTEQYPHDSSGGHATILQRITNDEIVRPRKVNPQIDADLEALLFKSLAKDPNERYDSAGGVADDIENFLQGEPLTARYPSAFYFLRKKMRKHRLRVAATTAALVLLVSGSIFGSIRITRERNLAITAANNEESLRKLAEQRLGDGLVSWANTLAGSDRWLEARVKYWDAFDGEFVRGSVPVTASLGLLDSYTHAPAVLNHFGTCSVIDNRLFSMDLRLREDGFSVDQPVSNGLICCYDAITGRQTGVIGQSQKDADVRVASYCDGGRSLLRAVAARNPKNGTAYWRIEKIDSRDGTIKRQINIDGFMSLQPIFSSDGKWAAFRRALPEDEPLVVLDIDNGSSPRIVHERGQEITCIAFSPDSKTLIGGSYEGQLTFWNPVTGLATNYVDAGLKSATDSTSRIINHIAFVPDGSGLLICDESGDLALLKLQGTARLTQFSLHSQPVNSLTVSHNGRFALSADEDGVSRLWDIQSGRIVRLFSTGKVIATCFSSDDRLLLSEASDSTIQVWSVEAHAQTIVQRTNAAPTCMAISDDGRLGAIGTANREIKIIDMATGERIKSLGLKGEISSLAFSSNGQYLTAATRDGIVARYAIFGSAQPVICYSGETVFGAALHEPLAPTGPNQNTLVSPDSRLACHLTFNGAILVDVSSAQYIRFLDHEPGRIGCFSPDGKDVVLVRDGPKPSISVCSTEKIESTQLISLEPGTLVTAVAIAPDHTKVFWGCADGTIVAYDLIGEQQVWIAANQHRCIRCLAVSPDGSSLLSGGDDGALRLWDVVSGREIYTPSTDLGQVTTAMFSPAGNAIWCDGGPNNTTKLWNLSLPLLTRRVSVDTDLALESIANNSRDPASIQKLIEWYGLQGADAWVLRLADEYQIDGGSNLTIARCQWKVHDPRAAANLESLSTEANSGDSVKYLRACADACKVGEP